jgi:mRNA interferase RelE/StbE
MNYELTFETKALKEWNKLDSSIKQQFTKILVKRLQNPHVLSSKLRGELKNAYKIKLRDTGYRLVYEVNDNQLKILVLAVGRRDQSKAYNLAKMRI